MAGLGRVMGCGMMPVQGGDTPPPVDTSFLGKTKELSIYVFSYALQRIYNHIVECQQEISPLESVNGTWNQQLKCLRNCQRLFVHLPTFSRSAYRKTLTSKYMKTHKKTCMLLILHNVTLMLFVFSEIVCKLLKTRC